MLTPPTTGFARSVKAHNVRIDSLAEWIEGCITFDEDRISKIDILDMLVEGSIYKEQDFAKERIGDAWKELRRRSKCLGQVCPYNFEAERITRTKPWNETSAYSFCLMLSLQVSYRPHFEELGNDYTQQGRLFEKLTQESLTKMGWSTHSTGWSKDAANSIGDKVTALATHLSEPENAGAVERWTEEHAKDGGLDVVCHFPFVDEWSGRPLLLVQCASGDDWEAKRATPVIRHWEKLIDFATGPKRGIAIPFALLADEFRRKANYDGLALLLDRHRISAPRENTTANWVSTELKTEIDAWITARIPMLMKSKAAAGV